jgi:hypothetical protein
MRRVYGDIIVIIIAESERHIALLFVEGNVHRKRLNRNEVVL